jgi:DNA-binding LytR/AlgR family response regulator
LDAQSTEPWRPTARNLAATWLRVVGAAAAVAAVLAVSGAFGVRGPGIIGHVAYWLAMSAIGATGGVLSGVYVMPREWFDRRLILAGAVITLVVGPPMCLASAYASVIFAHEPFSLHVVLANAPETLATTAAMVAISLLIRGRQTVETHAAPAAAAPPKFLARLPAKLAGAELWAVEAEDHYLRLRTSLGQDLILMRLGDAIGELEGIEGARTHRSWWVARAAVRGVEREDGRATLILPDGAEAPVSRAYARILRAAGWF